MKAIQQSGLGKADAVFQAFSIASNDVLIILDADLTVPPEDIPKFWKKISTGQAEYINGSRLVYLMESEAMRMLNYIANKIFAVLFTWLLGQRYTDTLCGTKVIRKRHFDMALKKNIDLGDFDPFGDFFIIFGASRLNLKMLELLHLYLKEFHPHVVVLYLKNLKNQSNQVILVKLKLNMIQKELVFL